ncbi:hypothetical protein CMUS01_03897 [Colletotrichum musicola]|uniref:Uncharacterized protein n=1 Tax=Colletotrichum musicola TaxID=2175873 RepID=A0A8H6U489_9PEZI|nr:hypothetical protein CMUS01_03897 [Colletotrichum musicola]
MSSSGGALKKGKMRGGFGGQRRKSGGSARCGVGSRGVIHWRCESEESSSRLESGGMGDGQRLLAVGWQSEPVPQSGLLVLAAQGPMKLRRTLSTRLMTPQKGARALREKLQGKNGDEDEEYETLNIKVWEGPG